MLPLLDGTRAPERLGEELSLSPSHVGKALDLLDASGLLEYVESSHVPDVADDPLTLFLSRTIGAMSREYPNVETIVGKLSAARVLIIANRETTAVLARDLAAGGIGLVENLGPGTREGAGGARPSLVVVLDEPGSGILEDTVAVYRTSDVPILRFSPGAGGGEFGPLFYRDVTACVDCFRASYADADVTAGEQGGLRSTILMGRVAAEVLALVAGVGERRSPRSMVRIVSSRGEEESHLVVPRGGCPACRYPQEADESPGAYEWQGEILPEPIMDSVALTPAQRERIKSLETARDSFPSLPRTALPPYEQCPAPTREFETGWTWGTSGAVPRIGPELIGGLLARVIGRRASGTGRGETGRRGYDTADIGSTDLYLLSETDLFGLPGTLLRYEDVNHSMAAVRRDRVGLADALAGTGLLAEPGREPDPGPALGTGAPIVVFLVSTLSRLRDSHGARACRAGLLDAGHAAMRLAFTAEGYGLGIEFAPCWDERVNGLLELYESHEFVSGIALIHATEGGTGNADDPGE